MIIKPHVSRWLIIALSIVAAFATGVLGARALNLAQPSAVSFGTGFSYQGYLRDDAGQPINDTCTLTFKLYDALNGGNQVGGDDVISNVAVTNGLFSVELNDTNEFGAAGFNGGGRFLEIIVQCSGDASPSTLSPRQPINPVPYALFAERFAGYENLIVVAKQGGDFTSVSDALNAIGVDPVYPAASANNPYLVYVAPGVYNESGVIMKEYVDIEGSGQGVTILTSDRSAGGITPNAATLVGASNAEVRHLTVENKDATGNWRFGIYTNKNTFFKNVTARATGGTDPRGMMVHNGGAPILIDVSLFASGGSNANLGLDVAAASITADGLYLNAQGGIFTHGAYLNTANAPILIENVTSVVSGGSNQTNGIYVIRSDVTLEGYNAYVDGTGSLVTGFYCTSLDSRLTIRGINVRGSHSAGSGSIRGGLATNCDLNLSDGHIDVSTNNVGYGIYYNSSITETKTIHLNKVDLNVNSSANSVFGLRLVSSGSGAASGQINDIYIEAAGNNPAASYSGVAHSMKGNVNYQDLLVNLSGTGNFMYGIQPSRGIANFQDIVINVYGNASITTFGFEYISAAEGGTVQNAVITAENIGTRDAVGFKVNNSSSYNLHNITARAYAPLGVWGFDLVHGIVYGSNLDAIAEGTADGATIRGVRCIGSDGAGTEANLHDVRVTAQSAFTPTVTYGVYSDSCGMVLSDGDIRTDAPASDRIGFFGTASALDPPMVIRQSYIKGDSATLFLNGNDTELIVTDSQLEGVGTTVAGSPSHTCTAVTHGTGAPFNFTAGPGNCP